MVASMALLSLGTMAATRMRPAENLGRFTYDPNGQAKTQTMGAKTTSLVYDTWARPKTYTDATSLVPTTTYQADGQVASMNDGLGTYTYTYEPGGQAKTRRKRHATGHVDPP
jgi:uncharacterized protein RhaS with RHS repeats